MSVTPPILLDITRLLRHAHRGTPTGIDRVELAYAERLSRFPSDRYRFVTIDLFGNVRRLPAAPAAHLVWSIGTRWRHGRANAMRIRTTAWMLLAVALFCPRVRGRAFRGERPYLLIVSHMHLANRRRIVRAVTSADAVLAAFIHDLIPIEFPEYVRPGRAAVHVRRVDNVSRLADTIIVNSSQTQAALTPWLDNARRAPRILVAALGVNAERLPYVSACSAARPYFVFVGTIEPRKNHLLMLQVWRRLAARFGAATPRLVLIGRRGWENENTVDLLERSSAIRELVDERPDLSDTEMHSLLRGSRAALFPSFAEGYGLPLAEALAMGVPALCADIPTLRDVGRDGPDYIDPLDGIGWFSAIQAYAREPSPLRSAQLRRLTHWSTPTWDEHFQSVFALLGDVRPRANGAAIQDTHLRIGAQAWT